MAEVEPQIVVHRYSAAVMAGWKSYPVRIPGPRMSICHDAPTLLVVSMEGGFVTANCSDCGKGHSVSQNEFLGLGLWVSCPICRHQMEPQKLSQELAGRKYAGNYAFVCRPCSQFSLLADLLPHWEDLMPQVTE